MGLDASRHQDTDGEISELVTVTRQAPQRLITVAHLVYLLGEAHSSARGGTVDTELKQNQY